MKPQMIRAAILTAALALSAVPATAAPPHVGWTKFGWRTICIELTDYRIRQLMAERGFTNVYLNPRIEREIRVRATMDGWVWQMDVSVCTGDILETRQLRPA